MRDRKARKRRDEDRRREEGRAQLLKQVRRRFSQRAAETARRGRRTRP